MTCLRLRLILNQFSPLKLAFVVLPNFGAQILELDLDFCDSLNFLKRLFVVKVFSGKIRADLDACRFVLRVLKR